MGKMYSKIYLKSFWKVFCLAAFLFCSGFSCSAQYFVRVNSSTKADISDISMIRENEGFFLADKIYTLKNGEEWTKSNLPSVRPISHFSANSLNDFWYATNLENSTSIIYHSHDKIVDNFVGPFGVSIYSMFVAPDKTPFFTSFSEVAISQNGKFEKMELVPTRSVIRKLIARNNKLFWILTDKNELFVYDGKGYRRILKDKKVCDFQIVGEKLGYALCDDELIGFNDQIFRILSVNNEFRKVDKIFVTSKFDIWLIGPQSEILKFRDGRLIDYSLKEKYTLRDISVVGDDEVWIAGNEGLILYHGAKVFPPYQKTNPGFSSFKLTNYSIDLDNEYGVAMADFNGDNRIDIFSVCISDVNRLYISEIKNPGERVNSNFFREEGFIRKTDGATNNENGSNFSELKLGVTVADVDNDGDEDIYICHLNSRNRLLLNDGNGVFRDVSDQPYRACENFNRSTAAAFADVDLDGSVDLYVTSENASNKLLHNDGTGHFTDITVSAGLETISGGSCASFSDINNDGYPDLCVTFWYGQNRIYLNETRNGVIKFREITAQTDLAKSPPVKSNGVSFADINNDGFPDLFIANRNDTNKLYLNDGRGKFRDVTDKYFQKKVFLSNGGVFADFDQDGFKDLYLTNVGENILYKNISGKYFSDVSTDMGAEFSGYSTGAAVGDLDNDGNVDIYAANYLGGSSKVFLNQNRNKNNIKFKLEGTLSNRDAIGARIYLYIKNKTSGETLAGFQEISGGGGYASISAKEAIFPLFPEFNYFALIKFPYLGSEMRIDDLKPGTLIVKEQTGLSAFFTHCKKSILRAFKDPEIRREFLKIACVLFFFLVYYRTSVQGKGRILWIRRSSVFLFFIGFFVLNLLFIFSSSVILFFLPVIIVVVPMIIMHLITERMQISRNVTLQRMKLREKISRDLHDDLASTLGSISIYSDTLKRMEDPVKSKNLSSKIADLTQSALQSITDIIWMTSPKNDSLQGLLAKANNHLYETFVDNGIHYQAEINMPEQAIVLPDELKNDTFLILKEATHNIIKHARAKSVTLLAYVNDHTCSITLMDDGIGFDEMNLHLKDSHGNGLINIRRRAVDSNIILSIHSHAGKGTIIHLDFKI